jgi:P27 family predicted phage terminase small subunit
MGRPPKPASIKELSGNPGQRAIQNEPKPVAGIPPAPKWLKGDALKQWKKVMPILDGMGVITMADEDAVAAYCVAYAQFVKATEDIEANGIVVDSYRGGVARNPAIQVQTGALDQMNKWGSKLGLSPVDRARLSVTPEGDQDGPGADVLSLLTGGA